MGAPVRTLVLATLVAGAPKHDFYVIAEDTSSECRIYRMNAGYHDAVV